MYLVDTNILIWALRDKPLYIHLIDSLRRETSVSISVITIGEIYQNILGEELGRTEELLSQFYHWNVTEDIAKQAGWYWQRFRKQRDALSLLDCMIAATCREHDLTLVTLNKKHFPMNDVRMYEKSE